MGDGKIKIFDAMTWNLESQYISTKSVVVNIYLFFIIFIFLFFVAHLAKDHVSCCHQ
jgi:hypothetical protein